jgi:hypothetical protein
VLPTPAAALGFAGGFFDIMGRDWGNIDRLRLDKFYTLVKRSLHEMFVALRVCGATPTRGAVLARDGDGR